MGQRGHGVVAASSGEGSHPFVRLTTPRLLLRPLRSGDAEALHLLFDHDEAVWGLDPGIALSRAARRDWVELRRHEAWTATGRAGLFLRLVTLRAGGTPIGCVGLVPALVPGGLLGVGGGATLEAELSWRQGTAFWGRGYMTEACRALLRQAFEALGLARAFAVTGRGNTRSIALMRRLGMRLHEDRTADGFTGPDPVLGIVTAGDREAAARCASPREGASWQTA